MMEVKLNSYEQAKQSKMPENSVQYLAQTIWVRESLSFGSGTDSNTL